MNNSQLNKSRFVVGLLLVGLAVLMFLFSKGGNFTNGAIMLLMLGLITVAISRKG